MIFIFTNEARAHEMVLFCQEINIMKQTVICSEHSVRGLYVYVLVIKKGIFSQPR